MNQELYERIFSDNQFYQSENSQLVHWIKVREIAQYHSISGQIVLADPEVSLDQAPLPVSFPKGRFPVSLSYLYDARGPSYQVGALRIQFNPNPIAQWEMIATKHLSPAFSPSSLLTCVVDEQTIGFFQKYQKAKVYIEPESLRKVLKRNPSFADVKLEHQPKYNLIAVQSGYRKQETSLAIARDARGNIVCLLVLFLGYENFKEWDRKKGKYLLPPPILNSAFIQWLDDTEKIAGKKFISQGSTSAEDLAFIQANCPTKIPQDILFYYQHCSPFDLKKEEYRDQWLQELTEIYSALNNYSGEDWLARCAGYVPIRPQVAAGIMANGRYHVFELEGFGRGEDLQTFFVMEFLSSI